MKPISSSGTHQRQHRGRERSSAADLDLDLVAAGVWALLAELLLVVLACAVQVFDELISDACRHGLAAPVMPGTAGQGSGCGGHAGGSGDGSVSIGPLRRS
ncbi:hypothetical protein GCM10027089_32390 [Nocardia thraciensis]